MNARAIVARGGTMKALRYIVSALCALALIVLAIYFSGGTMLLYVDIPSFLITAVLTVILLWSGWGFREMGAAFRNALSETSERKGLEDAALFFKMAERYLIVSGAMAFFLGSIAILKNLADKSRLGPNVAVALISVFYALFFGLLVCIPLEACARRRLKALDVK
jgi:flagellar motor component MotA